MHITVEALVHAPIAKVWSAYTTPEDIVKWNPGWEDWHTINASVDLREGGGFSWRTEAKDASFGFDFAGTYTKIVPLEVIEFAFEDQTGGAEFVQQEDGVLVKATFHAEEAHSVESQRQGWQAVINNFAKYVEAKA